VLIILENINHNNKKYEVKFDPNVIKVAWNELKIRITLLKKIRLLNLISIWKKGIGF